MKFGVVMRTDVPLSSIADLAEEAEAFGWDGFFLWDSFAGQDPWVLLTSVALRTERIRFGPLVTAPSRSVRLDGADRVRRQRREPRAAA